MNQPGHGVLYFDVNTLSEVTLQGLKYCLVSLILNRCLVVASFSGNPRIRIQKPARGLKSFYDLYTVHSPTNALFIKLGKV